MSSRSLVGGLTDRGIYTVYVHNGGHLPTLTALIRRDGVHRVLGTLLTARDGGWSYLDPREDGTRDHRLGERGRTVPGYGVAYTDEPGTMPVKFPDDWSEDFWADAVYLTRNDGAIRRAEPGRCECQCGPRHWEWRDWQGRPTR